MWHLKPGPLARVLRVHLCPWLLLKLPLFYHLASVCHMACLTSLVGHALVSPFSSPFQVPTAPVGYTVLPPAATRTWFLLVEFLSFLPAWSSTAWFPCFQYSICVIPSLRLMEGAWWTFFRWFRKLYIAFFYFLLFSHVQEHQSVRRDVRFRFRGSLDVRLTG